MVHRPERSWISMIRHTSALEVLDIVPILVIQNGGISKSISDTLGNTQRYSIFDDEVLSGLRPGS